MTNPSVTPSLAPDVALGETTLDTLSGLASGNSALVARPGLLTSLQQGNATRAQAATVNAFLVGLEGLRAVELARRQGTRVVLSSQEQSALTGMNVDYSAVNYTHDAAVNATASGASGAGTPAPTNPAEKARLSQQYGSQISSALHGGDFKTAVKLVNEAKAAGVDMGGPSHGWFDSPGDFFHHVTHNVATDTLTKGWNTVDTVASLGQQYSNPANVASTAASSVENVEAMQAMGYDPHNPLSVAAFTAHGYMHSDLSDLAKKWDDNNAGLFGWSGDQALIEARKFAADPQAYIGNITNSKTMTPEQKNALLSNKTFSDLVAEVQGRQATIGNSAARNVGLDPVKNPTAYAYTSAGIDLAASFVLDPTLAAFGAVKALKVAQIGLDGAADGEKIRKIMDVTNHAPAAAAVRRGWQSMMDDAAKIREGLDSGTDAGKVAAAQAMAHARAATPSIADMMPDLLGNKLNLATQTVEHGAPIANWSELTDHLASGAHLLRLTRGKAAIESALMPGAISRFSYRWVKGALSAGVAGRSMELNLAREANVERVVLNPLNAVDAATGETKVAQNVADAGAGDFRTGGAGPVNPAAVGSDVIANAAKDKSVASVEDALNPASAVPDVPAGLASARRAGELTAADKGDLLRLSRSGAGPAAQWARLKLAAQRVSTFLPRNNRIILGDSDGAEKVYRFARTFLTPGDAALYSAMFAHGSEGAQKAILDGIVQQVGHAAGLGTTEAGRELLDQLPELNYQRYGHTGNERFVDPATGVERDTALFPQQVRREFYLPNFQSLYRASAKLGIFQQTIGRVFNSQAADVFLDYERLAMLLKPNIAWRNIIEGQGNIAIRGKYLDLLRAKALAGTADVLTPRKTLLQRAITGVALDRVGRLYKGALTRTADPEWVAGVKEFTEGQFADEFRGTVTGYGRQMVDSAPDPLGVEDTDHIVRQGWHAQRMKRVGFGLDDAGGVLGADRYAHALGTRIGQFPDLDRALIEAVENPSTDVAHIVDLLRTAAIKPTVDRMVRASTVTAEDGTARFATSSADHEVALTKMAQLMVADMKYLLTDQQGNFIKPLADKIFETAKAPNGKWIQEHLTDQLRPKAVLAPTYRPVVNNGGLGFVSQLLDSTGRAYKYLVEDTIKRTTSEPAFLMNYGDARLALRSVQRDVHDNILQPLLDRLATRREGLSDEEYAASRAQAHGQAEAAAARIAHDAAVRRAYNATEYMIDDPGLKTQADIVGKNFLMFSRAVNAFIRRWGTLAIENPAALRRGFLGVEGLHHAGLLYTDVNGNVNFTYPGSDLAVEAFGRLSGLVPGLGPIVTYPVSGALSGQFNMLAPGFDNPARFSLSPMLNMPFHLVETLFPDHRSMFDEIDRAVNGQNAQGKPWYQELIPGAVSKLTSNVDEGKDSAFAGAMRSAIMYLYAADPNGTKGIFPPAGATPAEVDAFLSKLHTQVKNQMYFRAIFGEFAPSPPGVQTEQTKGAGLVDGLFTRAGVQNLDDEYKLLLAQTGGDRAEATAIFVAQHPARLVFTVPTTHAASNGAYLPTTPAAGKWINDNLSFIDKFKQLSAYFVPQQDGPFDLASYESQLETGLRVHYAPDEFLKQARITQAEAVYYDAEAARSAAYDKALTAGDNAQAQSINANYDAWKKQFLAANPMFAEKQASYAQTDQQALENIGDLRKLAADPSGAPSSVRAIMPQIKDMLAAYEAHTRFVAEHTSSNPYAYRSLKQDELSRYEAYMTGVAGKDGNLTSLYNGIFKPLTYATGS